LAEILFWRWDLLMVLGKKIFVCNEVAKMPYYDELVAMLPMVINDDWSKLVE